MTNNELVMLQALPLEIKVMKTEQRIRECLEHFGKENVVVSYSGGKDSEVLVDICRSIYKDIKILFINTGQEFPETIAQVTKRKKQGYNIQIVTPEMRYSEVVEKYGYPVISKQTSTTIYKLKYQNLSAKYRDKLMHGDEKGNAGKLAEKYKNLLDPELTFKISAKCCDILKKNPSKKWVKENGILCVITGEMAGESLLRKKEYLKTGCNAFENKDPKSKPLGFWKEEDIWEYIKIKNLEISECYTKFKMKRTGCYGCLFGCNMEERIGDNRIIKLMDTHPLLYKYLMDKLNYKEIMRKIGLRTYKLEQQKLIKED